MMSEIQTDPYIEPLNDLIYELTTNSGFATTPMQGVKLYRSDSITKLTSFVYNPFICVVTQGKKRMSYGLKETIYDGRKFLINSITLPVEAEILEASEETPFLSIAISIDQRLISQLLMEMGQVNHQEHSRSIEYRNQEQPQETATSEDGTIGENEENQDIVTAATLTPKLSEVLLRILSLVKDKEAVSILGPLYIKEFYYQVLKIPQGNLLRNCLSNDSRANRISPIVQYIETHYHQNIEIQDLTQVAGMSASTLHEHFKRVTSLSPMQFLKRLRLNHSKEFLAAGFSATETSYKVGYNSPSQFSREFRRVFNITPSEFVRAGELVN